MKTKEELKYYCNILQGVCTELYEEYGLTEEVLDLQTVINRLRHKHDITDESERINDNFVQ